MICIFEFTCTKSNDDIKITKFQLIDMIDNERFDFKNKHKKKQYIQKNRTIFHDVVSRFKNDKNVAKFYQKNSIIKKMNIFCNEYKLTFDN